MNLTRDEALALAKGIFRNCGKILSVDIALFPPATYISDVKNSVSNSNIFVGAQNMHFEEKGAFTGEISAKMVLTCGGNMVILGHSERRHIFGESNDFICAKVEKALASGLVPILCIGEKIDERNAGKTEIVLIEQLEGSLKNIEIDSARDIVIAYEPVWAIGTGINATPEQAQSAQFFIRNWLSDRFGTFAKDIRILYGGSLTLENAREIFSQQDIDGGLIGGASLKIDSFCGIVSIAKELTKEEK